MRAPTNLPFPCPAAPIRELASTRPFHPTTIRRARATVRLGVRERFFAICGNRPKSCHTNPVSTCFATYDRRWRVDHSQRRTCWTIPNSGNWEFWQPPQIALWGLPAPDVSRTGAFHLNRRAGCCELSYGQCEPEPLRFRYAGGILPNTRGRGVS